MKLHGYEKGEEQPICPRCGTFNPMGARYCYRCRQPLTKEETSKFIKSDQRLMQLVQRILMDPELA